MSTPFKSFELGPSRSSQLGELLGGGIGRGLEQVLASSVSQQANLLKNLGLLPGAISSTMKSLGLETLDPEFQDTLIQNAQKYIHQGLPPELASYLAIKESGVLSPQEQLMENLTPSEKRGGLLDLLMGTAEAREAPVKKKPSTLEGGLAQLLSGSAEPRGEAFPGQLKSKGLGLLRGIGNLAQEISGGIQTPEAIIEQIRGLPGETPEQKKERQTGEEVGEAVAAFAVPLPALGLAKPLQRFLSKRLANIASKFKKAPEEVGVAFEKFVEANPERMQAAKQKAEPLSKFIKDFEKSISKEKETIKKVTPGVRREAGLEKERLAKVPEKKEMPGLKESGKESLPKDRKDYLKLAEEKAKIQSSIKKGEKKYSSEDLSRAKDLEARSAENYAKSSYEAFTGRPYTTEKSISEQAFKALERIEEIAESGDAKAFNQLKKRFELKSSDERLIKELQKSGIPLEKSANTYTRVNQGYAEAILNRLQRVDEQIKAGKGGFEKLMVLNKEREMLNELLGLSKKKLQLADQRRTLKKVNKYLDVQKKLASAPPISQSSKKVIEVLKKTEGFNAWVKDFGQALGKAIEGEKGGLQQAQELFKSPFGKRIKSALKSQNFGRALHRLLPDKYKGIPAWVLTAAVAGLGFPSYQSLYRRGIKTAQGKADFQIRDEMKKYISKRDVKGLNSYIRSLKEDGVSKAKINKLLREARSKK